MTGLGSTVYKILEQLSFEAPPPEGSSFFPGEAVDRAGGFGGGGGVPEEIEKISNLKLEAGPAPSYKGKQMHPETPLGR